MVTSGRLFHNAPVVIEGTRKSPIRVRFQIIGNACIDNVGKYQSCMVSKVRIIWKQTVVIVGG